jgi:hypothetical protein
LITCSSLTSFAVEKRFGEGGKSFTTAEGWSSNGFTSVESISGSENRSAFYRRPRGVQQPQAGQAGTQ